MRKRTVRAKRKRRLRRTEESPLSDVAETSVERSRAGESLGAFYTAGPLIGLHARQRTGATRETERGAETQGRKSGKGGDVDAVHPISGQKHTDRVTVYTGSGPLRLRGRTDADFSFSYETRNVTTTAATGCRNCPDAGCVRCRGRLVIRYRVRTTVTLPSVSDFPDLTPCQQQRVRDAIQNVLAPHEQEHVNAFNAYNGTTTRRFDLTLCRSEFDRTIQSMVESEESIRRRAAQSASDALDPFHFDVDLDCEDEQ